MGCVCCLNLIPGISLAQSDSWPDWQIPPRFARPDLSSDEGGLWALMDREEKRVRQSPFCIRDPQLHDYVLDIICRLGGDHCPDIRAYVMHNPIFNAMMAPNGMMQVWTGLMLRIDNEAQLAAVLGHELGHYFSRHSIDQLRDAESRSAFAQFFGIFGLVGAVGQIAAIAGAFAHSREHERVADRIGLELMSKAGYDPAEAAKVWENLLVELKASPNEDPTRENPMFATHPPADERRETLARLVEAHPGGVTNEATWLDKMAPYRREWLDDEIKRSQHEQSIALLNRLISRSPSQPDYLFARAEVRRLRSNDTDLDQAINDYKSAISLGNAPPESYRGLGMIYMARKQTEEARTNLGHYLDLSPASPDGLMIKSYIEEMKI